MALHLSPADLDRLVRSGVIDPAQLAGPAPRAARPSQPTAAAPEGPEGVAVSPAAGRLTVTLDLPGLLVVSEANRRDHWAERHRRASDQRGRVGLALLAWFPGVPAQLQHVARLPGARLTCVLHRRGPRRLDDDNLGRALKSVRDEVAAWAGIDDGEPVWAWLPTQEPGQEPGVRITLEAGCEAG